MKIRFVKNILVEVAKPRLEETWDKYFTRWDEVTAESINYAGDRAEISTREGDLLKEVPIDSFEVITTNLR